MKAKRTSRIYITIAVVAAVVTAFALYLHVFQNAWSSYSAPTEPEYIKSHILKQKPETHTFIEIVNSCGPNYEGTCVNMRAGPGTEFASYFKLRNGMVLRVSTTTHSDKEGNPWREIIFDEWLRYPERKFARWYVSEAHVSVFERVIEATTTSATTSKHIVVDRSDQMLYAYDGEELYLKTAASTGKETMPTPRGQFEIFYKTPTRYMQGPLPGINEQFYDLPGVPWDMYFTNEGGAIHGAYWHNNFGMQWSSGCVNVPIDVAKKLYEWAPLGTKVLVRD
jgi:lipoprotein-anchoring transpeptidase ErfK/SrfK